MVGSATRPILSVSRFRSIVAIWETLITDGRVRPVLFFLPDGQGDAAGGCGVRIHLALLVRRGLRTADVRPVGADTCPGFDDADRAETSFFGAIAR
jgi:hypothetical protein